MFNYKKEYSRYRHYFLDIVSLYKRRQDVRLFLGTLLTLLATSFLINFALRPSLVTIASLRSQIKEKEVILEKMNQKIQALDSARSLVLAAESSITLLNESVPNIPLPDNFSRQVEGLIQRNSVTLTTLSINEVQLVGQSQKSLKDASVAEGASDFTITLVIQGGYENLKKFISEFEKLLRPIKVTSFSFSIRRDDQQTLVATITAKVPYYQPVKVETKQQ